VPEPTVFERVAADVGCTLPEPCQDHLRHARDVLHALATSDEVRAALVVVIAHWGATEPVTPYTLKTPAEERVADAILAAIDPEATDA
jgi:hypothetical protein